ncbi:hypothetical protein B5E58_10615 [Tyzzerella sp. An114]|uniref:hypothetical protein n=1 Tax=Tyzzerella sp. An114 TaxID=1965545 RepID=UPI000B44CAAA|nr:hypothetical protein [Tyzzerella sp. An114]OUQ56479.1 hypothetical protein B5E58_10615 [Tyzzerella sp. An114]
MDRDKILKRYSSDDFSRRRRLNKKSEDVPEGNIFVFQGYISAVIVFAVIIMTIAGGEGSRKILDKVSEVLREQIPFQQVVEKGQETVETIKVFGGKNYFKDDKNGEEGFIPDTSTEGQRTYMENNREDSGKMVN